MEPVEATSEDPSDGELVRRAADGDPAAERMLFDRHAPRVWRLARRIAGPGEDVADLVQEVFVRVFDKLGSFRGESTFTTWLHRVAVRTCLNAVRGMRRQTGREIALEHAPPVELGRGVNPTMALALSTAIDALPQALRLPLVMHALEGFSHREVAEVLGIPEGTSRRRVSEARATLREVLDQPAHAGGTT